MKGFILTKQLQNTNDILVNQQRVQARVTEQLITIMIIF